MYSLSHRPGSVNPRAFAPVPHALSTDRRLKPRAVMVAAGLLYYARADATCWPSDYRLSEYTGQSVATVRRGLADLEQAEWIERRQVEPTFKNQTGRLIGLSWRQHPVNISTGGSVTSDRGGSVTSDRRLKDVALKQNQIQIQFATNETIEPTAIDWLIEHPLPPLEPPRFAPEPPTAQIVRSYQQPATHSPQATIDAPAATKTPIEPLTTGQTAFIAGLTPAQRDRFNGLPPARRAWMLQPHALGFDPIMARAATTELTPQVPPPPPPQTVAEATRAIEQRDPTAPAILAELLTRDFGNDRKSWRFFRLVAERVWTGAATPAQILEAHRQATSESARNRGAVFVSAAKRLGLVDGG